MTTDIITTKERKFFNVAKAVADTSDYSRVHVGCAITYKKTILSVASNSEKTHSLQYIYNKFRNFDDTHPSQAKVHAEIHALSWLVNKPINWSDVSLYTYREWKNGTPAISKPCPACMKLIKDLGIKTIYYINENGKQIKERI